MNSGPEILPGHFLSGNGENNQIWTVILYEMMHIDQAYSNSTE